MERLTKNSWSKKFLDIRLFGAWILGELHDNCDCSYCREIPLGSMGYLEPTCKHSNAWRRLFLRRNSGKLWVIRWTMPRFMNRFIKCKSCAERDKNEGKD